MRFNRPKATLKTAVLAVLVLLLGANWAVAQQQINLTAGPSTITLPDGAIVPMWGYSCGTIVVGSTATCAKSNPTAAGWSPVVITVPTNQTLVINLTNSLSFTTTGVTTNVPTSLTIVGQLGGGLGSLPTRTASPDHVTQTATWPAADSTVLNNPPAQPDRVQSFATEVAAGTTANGLTWTTPRAGTYLLESGTHPSIQGPMGLFGMVVVTAAPAAVGATGTAYPGVTYNAEVPLLLSEIDPVQNKAVDAAVRTDGFSETKVWSGQPGGCGNPSSGAGVYQTCYPPAVNYSPLYYLINGVAFDKTHAGASLFPTSPATGVAGTGTVLVRIVNAGLKMHIPSIVGAQRGTPAGPQAPSGFALIAEDGNPLPGTPRLQSEVFMAPGKTYDVMINVPAAGGSALPIFDRQGGLSANATTRDGGMLAYIGVNGAGLPSVPAFTAATTAVNDTYNTVIAGHTLAVSNPSKGVIANDTNVYSVKVFTAPSKGTLTLNTDGTFTYVPNAGWTSPDTFRYQANGSGPTAQVTLGACTGAGGANSCLEAAGQVRTNPDDFTSTVSTNLQIKPPGVLANDVDGRGYPLTVNAASVNLPACTSLSPATPSPCGSVDANGGFNVYVAPHAGTLVTNFRYRAENTQGTASTPAAGSVVTMRFPAPSNLAVTLVDGLTKTALNPQDYRWIIEEDKTFYVDPNCQTNPLPAGCPVATTAGLPAPAIFGTNFHTSYMPVVAQGCTGPNSCESGQSVLTVPSACDIGNGACRPATSKTPVLPSQVVLDPTKHYFISVLPGDAMDDVDVQAGHAMGGANIAFLNGSWRSPLAPTVSGVQVVVEPENQPPAKVSVFVFQDDHPLNGEHDASGGVDILAPNEPGLGGFNITIIDLVGMSGDSAGQMTYDEFNQPLSNSLAGTIDPLTTKDACPISPTSRQGVDGDGNPSNSDAGITGVIPVCPTYEADGTTLSPLAGQAIVANMPPGRYGIIATPAADRIARGEEWLQTNTLDGGKDHEAFIKVNEPGYFQEFGPAGYHVSIGFANPKFITDQGSALCNGPNAPACNETVKGIVTGARMSRTPDQRLYASGSRDTFGYTQCYASLGSPDGADISFAKCDADGNFTLTGIPAGDWRLTIFDQWNDQIVDGISTPVRVGGTGTGNTNADLCHGPSTSGLVCDMGEIGVHGWKNNLTTRTFFDTNLNGVSDDGEQGLSLVPTNIRYRDGSISNLNSTDLEGFAGFNEVFPIFNWYVLETDSNRYKNTGTHVINDAGGPVDGSTGPYACGQGGYPSCGQSALMQNMARTAEDFSVPTALRVPGARYCANADCPPGDTAGGSTGRVDPAWVTSYGWQSFMGQNQLLEFGKAPFAPGENGGIRGHVVYASTRPFDDPALLLQLTWEPQVPHVTINLYQEGFAPDGITPTLKKVDTTTTSSWDDWAQGFRSDGIPNMNCPGQSTTDPFFYTLRDQPNYLDWYNAQHATSATDPTPLPNNSQYKCYDGMHNWNQLQPAPYDGMYKFPSVTGRNPSTGIATGTGCSVCTIGSDGEPMLPAGKYVVEMIVPPGYELVKEEDKNILLGDTYTAPVTNQFTGFGNIFIMPDQAAVAASYNANNALIQSTDEGVKPRHEGDTGSVETFWPCVGAMRIVPDYNSLFPGAGQNAPFAGATRPLCDRKEVTLEDQMSVLAKFYVFSSTHIASHFTGIITDDFTSEFDPFSPAFGEKFAPANMPVGIKDWAGNQIGRVYSDQHGIFDGLTFSTFAVNPPDPSGYIPNVLDMCMNDHGDGTVPDPLYQPAYSQFCYEWTFMPGQTSYLDTPVIPTSAFAPEYNHPDCAYPAYTPAIAEVDGDGVGPYVSASGSTLTIHALGDQVVSNYGYSGPSTTTAPWNQKTVTRHYGFGATRGTGGVTIGGVPATVTGWNDTTITVTVPANVPLCSASNPSYTGANASARCGELLITAGNGMQSIDTVNVTIGGTAPTRLTAGQTIQSAIDAANPGDLIIVPPGKYHEMVVMWKPVRLQGVGAASSVIDANTHPSGNLLNDWRKRVVCLFGLGEDGRPSSWTPGCAVSNSVPWHAFTGATNSPQVDRIPSEATVGWDTTLNGNLAEQLQEPSLMGAYEGAGITVLARGIDHHGLDPFADAEGAFLDGTTFLLDIPGSSSHCSDNLYPSNFVCNPSRIDGLSITNSSQGGGGIFVHAWAHYLEISNNRVYNNQGTLAGGITVGQGEFPPQQIAGAAILAPGSCESSPINGTQLPYCHNLHVNVHNNAVTLNASEGDELFSASPSGAGGVAFCSGADYYRFNFNWVCGNLSTGDGAGVAQAGFVYNASIEHNTILFNQGTNPTTPSNGGGLLIMNQPDTDPTCPSPDPDADCSHAFQTVGDGTGPGMVINANLIMGNAAEAGAGGGIRFQSVNGIEVSTFPNNPERWYSVNVTNNIIANNVAGWDGGGVSLQDSIGVNLINNTIISNDSTASSGSLFGAFFAPQASAPTPCPRDANGANIPCVPLSNPQPAGVSSAEHTAEFLASLVPLASPITCPAAHPNCETVSIPELYNDVVWQNRAFNIVVGNNGSGQQNQQAVVSVAPSLNQTSTGDCQTGARYWDLGLRGDLLNASGVNDHGSGFSFSPQASVLTDTGYPGGASGFEPNTNSFGTGVVHQYCNGSKRPPEATCQIAGVTVPCGYQVPPGTNEGNVPVPVFNLTAGATVDEGNNWINISWGPLSLTRPTDGTLIGDYSLTAGASAVNYIAAANSFAAAPALDFFGNDRKANSRVDAGAVEFGAGAATTVAPTLVQVSPNFGRRGTAVSVTLSGSHFLPGATVAVSGTGVNAIPVTNVVVVNETTITATFTIGASASLPPNANATHTVTVTTSGGTSNPVTFTVQLPTTTSISPNSGARGTSPTVTITGTNLQGATSITAGTNIITSNIVVNPAGTSLTATFQIGAGAALTNRNVQVVTPGGTTPVNAGVRFRVTP